MTAASSHAARDRVQRMLYLACGLAAVVFGGLMLTGSSGILASLDQLASWYSAAAIALVVVLPVTFVATAFTVPLRWLDRAATLAVVGFLAVQLSWVPAMHGDVLADNGEPWLQGVNAIASTLAGVRWRGRIAWLFPLIQGVLVPVIQLQTAVRTPLDAVLDGLGAVLFCAIVTGLALSAVQAAQRQDDAASEAHRLAAVEAARRTREREQSRINAIVHDDVMSVLLAASHHGASDAAARSATAALASVAQIAAPSAARSDDYGPAEAVAALRGVPADLGVDANVDYVIDGCPDVPPDAVVALAEAVTEAVRNAVRHGGPDVRVGLAIRADSSGLRARVTDDGPGFDPSAVSPLRLGLRVSIDERMAAIAGGTATIDSVAGGGTTVTVAWSPS